MIRRLFVMALASLLAGCSKSDDQPAGKGPAPPSSSRASTANFRGPEKLPAEHLPNPVRIHPKVISGGLPEGDAAFRELKTLGVQTIISVDGARPEVELAARYGMRYVHLPHGYDGIPDNRVEELAKAVRDLPGAIYIHCHHGKHRSPAAASVACVAAGLIPPESALAVLELAGTSPNYRGLYQSAEVVRPFEHALLDALNVEFPATAELPPMAEAMVAIEQTYDRLREIAASGWKTPVRHPDLDPPHEALLLREHFTELLRTDEVRRQPDEFRALLRDSQLAAEELEDGLRDWQRAADQTSPPENLKRAADRISHNCTACHQRFRDVPLGEKSGL